MHKKGFTIIELLVGMVLFMIVVGSAVSIFLSIVKYQRQILAEERLLSQISYAKERVSKALRMAKKQESSDVACIPEGYIYQLTRPKAGFYTGIRFINQSNNNACQEFVLDNAISGNTDTPLVLKELINSYDLSDAVPLTSEDLEIIVLKFGINGKDGCYGAGCLDGAIAKEGSQPKVTVLIMARALKNQDHPIKIFQTTVSQRNLND